MMPRLSGSPSVATTQRPVWGMRIHPGLWFDLSDLIFLILVFFFVVLKGPTPTPLDATGLLPGLLSGVVLPGLLLLGHLLLEDIDQNPQRPQRLDRVVSGHLEPSEIVGVLRLTEGPGATG